MAKSIQTNKKKIAQQLKEFWSYVGHIYKQESLEVTAPDIENITPEKVNQAIDKSNEALATRNSYNKTGVDAVFGNIKHNMNFKRFMLRGIEKVKVKTGLIALVYNLKKYLL